MITCQQKCCYAVKLSLLNLFYSAARLHLLREYLTNKFNIPEFTQLFYLILPSNDNLHFFIGSSTSMHRPPAEYDISLSPVKLVSGSDGSSSNPTSGIYQQCNTHVKLKKQSAMTLTSLCITVQNIRVTALAETRQN